MHPIEFRDEWKMTNLELAFWLGKTEQTVKQYAARQKSKAHRNPSKTVFILCEMLDKQWKSEGAKPEFNPVALYLAA